MIDAGARAYAAQTAGLPYTEQGRRWLPSDSDFVVIIDG